MYYEDALRLTCFGLTEINPEPITSCFNDSSCFGGSRRYHVSIVEVSDHAHPVVLSSPL